MFIPIIIGATRPGNYGRKVGKFIQAQLNKLNSEIEIKTYSPLDFNLSYDGEKSKEFSEIIMRSEKFILVISEYNHGIPGKLKTLIDSIFEEYKGKKVLLIGVSNGEVGGARAIEGILPTLKAIGAIPMQRDIRFPKVDELFDENGNILSSNLQEISLKVLSDFIKF